MAIFIVVNLQKAIENGHIYSGKLTESYWKWSFIVANLQKAFENGHL